MKSIFSFVDADAGWAIHHKKMAYTSEWREELGIEGNQLSRNGERFFVPGYAIAAMLSVRMAWSIAIESYQGITRRKGMLAAPLFAPK